MKTTTAVSITATILSANLLAQKNDVYSTTTDLTNTSDQSIISEDIIQKKYINLSFDARLRYEFREQGLADSSNAGTLRIRPGITFLPDNDLSFFIEGEFTRAIIEDFNSGPQPSLNPSLPGNTNIFDPDTTELNRANVRYAKHGFEAKVGRQRYILDNAAFVGNLIWRQNEQTYDAASLSYTADSFGVSYAYVNRVNRIFGTDADGIVQSLEGDIHLVNGWKKFKDSKVGAYAYLIDIEGASTNSFANRASSNTYGAFLDYKGFHFEYALQVDGGGSNLDRGTTDYAHVYYETHLGSFHVKAGLEYLDADFYTPLSTVHLFNGWADRFIGTRLGLADSPGINDFYIHAGTKVSDIHLKGFVHYFYDDSFSEDFGWEVDLVAIKPLNKNTKLISKFAYYDGGATVDDDITQVSVQVDYSF